MFRVDRRVDKVDMVKQSDIRVLSMILARVDRMGRVDAVDKVRQPHVLVLCRCSR